MVVKEALHNIVKHSGATNVAINIFLASNKIKCTIVDNGKGIPSKNNSPSGNGLRNMQQRISETGGTLIIHSEPDKGTSLDFVNHFIPKQIDRKIQQ
jgi:two-component system NarL family sensor kinase